MLRAIIDHGDRSGRPSSLFEKEVTEATTPRPKPSGMRRVRVAKRRRTRRRWTAAISTPTSTSCVKTSASSACRWSRARTGRRPEAGRTAELLQEAGADAIELTSTPSRRPLASGASIESGASARARGATRGEGAGRGQALPVLHGVRQRRASPRRRARRRPRALQPVRPARRRRVGDRSFAESRALATRRLRVALRWLAILRGRIDVSLAATGSVLRRRTP